MLGFWMFITGLSSFVLIASAIFILMLYRTENKERKVIRILQVVAVLLIFSQTSMIFLPIPQTHADNVITFKIVINNIAFILLGVSFWMEMKKTKTPMKKQKEKRSKI